MPTVAMIISYLFSPNAACGSINLTLYTYTQVSSLQREGANGTHYLRQLSTGMPASATYESRPVKSSALSWRSWGDAPDVFSPKLL